MPLWEYQEKPVTDAERKFDSGVRTLAFQLPTGGGKTVVFSYICKDLLQKKPDAVILILVHREELLASARKTLYNECQITAQSIVSGKRFLPKANVYVGMVESAKSRLALLPKNPDLVIIDEAHRADFNKMHAYFPECKIMGFSATPLSSNKKIPMKLFYEDIVCGPQIDELIQFGKDHPGQGLCQNITYAPKEIVDRHELSAAPKGIVGSDFNVSVMAAAFSKTKYVKNTVEAYKKYAPNTKAIIFNCDIEHSILVQKSFTAAGFDCKHLDGSMTGGERRHILNWFKYSKSGILCNCEVATTGFDEPTIETVIVNRSTMSMPLWLQMCGRGSRALEWKRIFTIIDMGGNAMVHGDWCDPRNWQNIFFNPPKPGKPKDMPAPVKMCPKCDAIVHAATRQCRFCGYTWEEKEVIESQLPEFVCITKKIDVSVLLEQPNKKKMWAFFEIGRQLAVGAKETIDIMTNEKAGIIFCHYLEKLQEWGKAYNHKIYKDHENQASQHLLTELQKRFKKWEGAEITMPAAPVEAVPVAAEADKVEQEKAKARVKPPMPEKTEWWNPRGDTDPMSRTEFSINAPDFDTFSENFKLF